MIAALRTWTRTTVTVLVLAMLLAMPGVAQADDESEATPSGLCVIAWVQVLSFSPVGFTNWFCVGNCGTLTSSGPLGPDAPPVVWWDVGVKVPDPFNPNVFCSIP